MLDLAWLIPILKCSNKQSSFIGHFFDQLDLGAVSSLRLLHLTQIDEEDEQQALLMAASQGMAKERRAETSPLEQEWLEFRSGGLVIGKNLDVLKWWFQHEKQFPLLSGIVKNIFASKLQAVQLKGHSVQGEPQ